MPKDVLRRELSFVQAVALNMIDMVGIGPFVVLPLVRPDHRPARQSAEAGQAGQLAAPFSRKDVLYLGSSRWNAQVCGERERERGERKSK